jgi:CHAD domain-containing protein
MLPGLEAGDPRAIHQARVATRRLRELLPVLQLEPKAAQKIGRRLRKATRRLGRVRELDVALAHVTQAGGQGRAAGKAALSRIAADLRAERKALLKRSAKRHTWSDLGRVARKLDAAAGEAARGKPDSRRWRWVIEARIAHRAALLRRAIEQAGTVYLPERLHGTRIALKKLRYGVELGVEAEGLKSRSDLRLLKRMQDVLGSMHDRQVLIERVRGAQAALTPVTDATAWREIDAVLTGLEDDCRRLHGRFMRSREGLLALCDHLGAQGARGAAPARRAG